MATFRVSASRPAELDRVVLRGRPDRGHALLPEAAAKNFPDSGCGD